LKITMVKASGRRCVTPTIRRLAAPKPFTKPLVPPRPGPQSPVSPMSPLTPMSRKLSTSYQRLFALRQTSTYVEGLYDARLMITNSTTSGASGWGNYVHTLGAEPADFSLEANALEGTYTYKGVITGNDIASTAGGPNSNQAVAPVAGRA